MAPPQPKRIADIAILCKFLTSPVQKLLKIFAYSLVSEHSKHFLLFLAAGGPAFAETSVKNRVFFYVLAYFKTKNN